MATYKQQTILRQHNICSFKSAKTVQLFALIVKITTIIIHEHIA